MRFSSIFQIAAVPLPPALPVDGGAAPAVEIGKEQAPPVPLAAPELPDDLDARVRLVGEWQLGED